ncbi:hypothetical protein FDB30_04260 [Clostridium botulinum]|uniref:Uncharacterized protein n=1 Tax=Clostridium botulinum TaxID=1491 RepID=A0A846JPG3_CLOBO|nr:hypothetical protein [Clostridium botulinum]KAI3346251.1 hypothetical protein CIT18_14515 [Clostridium botulinum]KOM88864.1 hypothetical protein ACP51_06470 [Clostridium botulinum]KOR57701.1 hypothetical protein ADT22_13160 [Clostridium botulinum]NFE13035.1 hypothetical protein [Clostridium botulinum]NFE85659.1 hypothetical protein [Clostridium botulinum]
MNVKCENANCKYEFEPQVKEQYLGAMIGETYFECPKCGAKYIICLDNCKTRKLKIKINNLKAWLSSGKVVITRRPRVAIELEMIINEHKQAMSKLMKGEYEWRYQTK